MKKLFLVAAAFIMGTAAYAQTGKTSFGLKAGINLPKYRYEDSGSSTKTITSYHLTGYADIPFSTAVSFQPGISLQGKGGKVTILGNDITQDVMSIDIPLNIVGYFPAGPGKVFIGAGPYVGFNVAGKVKAGGVKEDLEIGNKDADDIKGTDVGLNGLVGYQFASGFNIGAGYGLGLSNLSPKDNSGKVNNRVLSFSVGFAF